MTNEELAKRLRVLRHHAETIVVRCRAVEDAILRGEMFGAAVPSGSIERHVKAIEQRFTAAARMIGIQPPTEDAS
jgi:hypothetical protein